MTSATKTNRPFIAITANRVLWANAAVSAARAAILDAKDDAARTAAKVAHHHARCCAARASRSYSEVRRAS